MRLPTTRCGWESSCCPFVRMFHVWRLSSPPDTDGFKGSSFPLFIIECNAKQYITTSTTFSHNSPNPLSWCGCVSAAVAVEGFCFNLSPTLSEQLSNKRNKMYVYIGGGTAGDHFYHLPRAVQNVPHKFPSICLESNVITFFIIVY